MSLQTSRACIALKLAFLCSYALTTVTAHAQSAPRAAPSPLLFHASFDNTLDASGPHGTIKPLTVTGRVEYRPGKFGQALLCGGDGATLTYPVEHNVRPSQGTIAMWVQPVDWAPDDKSMHVFETTGPGWLVLYRFLSGGVLMLSGSDRSHYASAWDHALALPNGQWHHLAGVWSHDQLALYIDGVKKQTYPLPPLPSALHDSFMLGDSSWATPHIGHTLIEDVNIYRYALPADQIALSAQGKPVTYSPLPQVSVVTHPTANRMQVSVDAAAYLDDDAGGKTEVELLNHGALAAHASILHRTDGVGVATFNLSDIAAGHYDIRADIVDAAGHTLATANTPFNKPPPAPWINNKLGMRDIVLPPYTPLQVTTGAGGHATTVACWGRKYALDGLFPSQIESGGVALLAAPISLTGATLTGAVGFDSVSASIDRWGPTRAHQHATGRAEGFDIATDSTLEYDGMVWTDLTITPHSGAALSELTLHIPVRAADALYLHHSSGTQNADNAGNLAAAGYATKLFRPCIWLGNNDRGLQWFAETQQGWSNAAGKPVEEVVRNGDVTEIQIHFINEPTKVGAPLRLSFGLQATPVKPQQWNRGWRMGQLEEPTVDKLIGMGNIQTLWSDYYLKYYGYPEPQDDATFRKLVADLHARHVLAVPYINLNFLSQGAPESEYYSADWRDSARSYTTGDVGQMGFSTIGACPHSAAWRDFIAYKIAKFVDRYNVDGIYVDCWFPYACTEDHGCGWRDAAGNLQPRYPIRDYREIMRRVREIFAERRPNFHILAHMSSNVVAPTLSFADSMLDGEQYDTNPDLKNGDYLDFVPLDKWRAEHDGIPWGMKSFFLPEFQGVNRHNPEPTQRLMGIMLAHDISPWPIWCNEQVVFDAWKAMDRFGAAQAQFMPYWKPTGVSTDNQDVVVSAYRQGKRAMLVVFNTSKQNASVQVAIDPTKLGIGAKFKATDLMSQTAVPGSAAGFGVDVAERGFRLIEVR